MLSAEELRTIKDRIVHETKTIHEPVDKTPDVKLLGEALLMLTRRTDSSKVCMTRKNQQFKRTMGGRKPWVRYRAKPRLNMIHLMKI